MKRPDKRSRGWLRHVQALLEAHHITVEWIEEYPVAFIEQRFVKIPKPTDRTRYLQCLHEIGHVLNPGLPASVSMVKELLAWAWTLDQLSQRSGDCVRPSDLDTMLTVLKIQVQATSTTYEIPNNR